MVCQLIQDHPRRCGENKEAQAIKVLCTGSPPQVRGKLGFVKIACTLIGITPAGAGKTFCHTFFAGCVKDHPRRCGENSDITSQRSYKSGSPPQVRGKLGMAGFGIDTSRITPAGAGKTRK